MRTAGGHWRARWGFAIAMGVAALAIAWPQGSPASGEGPASATASRAKKVSIVDFSFKPGKLTVSRGAKVTFSNAGDTTHTATGAGFDTGNIKPGRAAAVTFKKRGTFAYHCGIHPFMKGKIVVK